MSFVTQPDSICYANSPIIYDTYFASHANNAFKYILNLRIWTGDKSSVPASSDYTLMKAPNAAGKAVFDVSRLVREHIVVQNPSELTEKINNSVSDVVWVQARVSASYDGGSESPVTSNTTLATRGYTWYEDGDINGINDDHTGATFPTSYGTYVARDQGILEAYGCIDESLLNEYNYLYPSGGYLPTYAPLTYNVSDYGKLTLGLFTDYVDKITLTDDNGGSHSFYVSTSDDSTEKLKYINVSPVKVREYGLSWTNTYTLTASKDNQQYAYSYTINVQCEAKYQPVQLIYLNKLGVWDYLTFFKRSSEQIQVKNTQYFNSSLTLGNSSTGVSIDRERGEMNNFNANGYRSYVLNTGYVNESEKERIEQLLLSEKVIMDTGSQIFAVVVQDKSMDMKKSVNEKLINYTISVRDAHRRINKVNA
jgi:hypothetical protein